MERFVSWLDRIVEVDLGATQTYVPDPAQTGEYVPGMGTTASYAGDTTNRAGGNGGGGGVPDPGVVQQIGALKGIHGQLRDIFADIRGRAAAFRSSKMRGAFEREMVAGIDGIGRSHAILAPSGEGGEVPS